MFSSVVEIPVLSLLFSLPCTAAAAALACMRCPSLRFYLVFLEGAKKMPSQVSQSVSQSFQSKLPPDRHRPAYLLRPPDSFNRFYSNTGTPSSIIITWQLGSQSQSRVYGSSPPPIAYITSIRYRMRFGGSLGYPPTRAAAIIHETNLRLLEFVYIVVSYPTMVDGDRGKIGQQSVQWHPRALFNVGTNPFLSSLLPFYSHLASNHVNCRIAVSGDGGQQNS